MDKFRFSVLVYVNTEYSPLTYMRYDMPLIAFFLVLSTGAICNMEQSGNYPQDLGDVKDAVVESVETSVPDYTRINS